MHPEVLNQDMLALSDRVGFLKDFSFYLAGGTGLALQLGHRKSFDFDFFTSLDFSPEELSALLKKHNLSAEGKMRSPGTLYCVLEGIRTSFIFYDVHLGFPVLYFNSIDVADWRDIVVEKLRLVADRGQKKDFFDLYFGLRMLNVETLVGSAVKKFGKGVNYFHLLKGITYFEDAEKDPDPMLVGKSLAWQEVKHYFLTHIQEFEKAFDKSI
jgi:hypothetical protein